MDIVPTHHLLSNMTAVLARVYYHWLLLAQPSPFPETFINNDPDGFFEHVMLGVGNAKSSDFDASLMNEYRRFWRDPEFVRCSCNDYRAAIDIDYALDEEDKDKVVDCPALVLFGRDGAMGRMLDVPATWRPRLSKMTAKSIKGGHHFPEQASVETTSELMAFLESL